MSILLLTANVSMLIAQQTFWKQMNVSPNAYIYAFVVTPQGQMFAGTDKGVYCSADTGKTWVERKSGLPAGSLVWLLTSDSRGTVFAGVNTRAYEYGPVTHEGIYRLISDDTVWKAKNSGLDTLGITALCADQKNNIVYAGTGWAGGYRLRDTDTSWQLMDSNLSILHLDCFLVDTINGYVFVGTDGGIYRSSNFGATWSLLGNTTTFQIMTMAINSKGYIFAGSGPYGVFRSMDNGINWVEKNPMMMDSLATNIVVNSKDIVYANTQSGIYSSTNNGDSWTALSGSLSETTYLGLDANQYLYAGTKTGSIYRTISSTMTGVSIDQSSEIKGYRLDNNYPNPFNPVTTISFDVPELTHVSIRVYDCLGRYVATLANRKYISGHHEERFDASELCTGVYFYKLQAGSYTSVKKMVVIK